MKAKVTGNSHHYHAQGEPRVCNTDAQIAEGQSLPTSTFTDILQAIRAAKDQNIAWKVFRRSRMAENGCWEWTGALLDGYGAVRVGPDQLAHRVVYRLIYGKIGSGLLVCHHCDNRKCIRPDHLFLGTHQDNSDDAVAKGRIPRGENNPRAILSEALAREIKRQLAGGNKQTVIAARLGVALHIVSDIASGGSWKWMEV